MRYILLFILIFATMVCSAIEIEEPKEEQKIERTTVTGFLHTINQAWELTHPEAESNLPLILPNSQILADRGIEFAEGKELTASGYFREMSMVVESIKYMGKDYQILDSKGKPIKK